MARREYMDDGDVEMCNGNVQEADAHDDHANTDCIIFTIMGIEFGT